MKRTLLWFAILVTSTLVWLTFTDIGRSLADVHLSAKDNAPSMPQQIGFVPAQQAPTEPLLHVRLSGSRNLGLIVTDSQGRRSGIDMINQSESHEIPNSSAERVLNHENSGSAAVVVVIKPATATLYFLEIAGTQAGKFCLAVSGVSPKLESTTVMEYNGRVPADTSLHYKIDLTKIPPRPSHPASKVADPAEAFVSSPEERIIAPADPAVLAAAAVVTKDPCGYFSRVLEAVPHEKLTRHDGEIEFFSKGEKSPGCEIVFVTNDTLLADRDRPSLEVQEGTELYRMGWRVNDSMTADGPGTGIFGLENVTILCLVSHDQPAYFDDETGRIEVDSQLVITVRCRQKNVTE